MPAYSFQEKFVPIILDGSKTHTIRAPRKGRSGHAMPGQLVYLYFGMRTQWCRKLGEGICTRLDEITIYSDTIYINGKSLCTSDAEAFAWKDGFRPDGSTIGQPTGALELMMRFWLQTHGIPFKGWVIHWKMNAPDRDATEIYYPIDDPDLYFTGPDY